MQQQESPAQGNSISHKSFKSFRELTPEEKKAYNLDIHPVVEPHRPPAALQEAEWWAKVWAHSALCKVILCAVLCIFCGPEVKSPFNTMGGSN